MGAVQLFRTQNYTTPAHAQFVAGQKRRPKFNKESVNSKNFWNEICKVWINALLFYIELLHSDRTIDFNMFDP